MQGILIGCDVGGTFTDAFAYDPEQARRVAAKAPTTPEDQSQGALSAILDALERLGAEPGTVAQVVHGTTTATNAVLERDLARTALVTHRGMEDLLEIGRQTRPSLYDLAPTPPEPLVAREDRHGITGRLDAQGNEVQALDEDELDALGKRLSDQGIGAVAVCLLHAYRSSEHEAAVADVLDGHLEGVPVVASHRVSPEVREVERFSTTVLNAALLPGMRGYLERLTGQLQEAGIQAPVTVLDSAGALMDPTEAAAFPVRTVLSGPAGGAAGALLAARELGAPDLLGVDMGGTSTDVTLVHGGEPTQRWEAEIAGHPLQVATADIHTVGAGGGSIAWVDEAGGLRVGPESAGANPGPACYGRGGQAPTLTDAHVVLGRIPADVELGERVPVQLDAAEQALERLGDELDLAPEQAALAVLEVATATAVRGIRVLTARHAVDPEALTLLAFGGAGPLLACRWAAELGISRVVVPPEAGVHSAVGLLAAPPRVERSRSVLAVLDEAGLARTREAVHALPGEARGALDRPGAEAATLVSARYKGQSHELTVALPDGPPAKVREAFEAAHQDHFGYRLDDATVELVTARARVQAPASLAPDSPGKTAENTAARGPAAPLGTQQTWFLGHEAPVEAQRYDRDALEPGDQVAGPAILVGRESTTVVPPGWVGRVQATGHLVIEQEGAR